MSGATRQIDLLCMQSLFRNAPASNFSVAAGGLLVNFYFSSTAGLDLRYWAAFMVLISMLRFILSRYALRSVLKQDDSDNTKARLLINTYTATSFASGCGWGALAFLVPPDLGATHISVFYIIMFSIMSAAFISLTAILKNYFVYILPVYLSLLYFSFQGNVEHISFIPVAATIYFLFTVMAGITVNKRYRQNFALILHNEELIEQLNGEIEQKESFEKRLIEQQHQLENTVEKRTSELRELNRALVSEINERRRIESNLKHMAHHDSLTNLPNRLLLDARLNHAISRAKRDKLRLAVLFIDLDHFKSINDTLGHSIGDRLLVEIGQRLQSCIREDDTLARLGGDEFVIIIEQVHNTEKLSALLDKIMQCTAETIHIDEHRLSTSASIGISFYPEDGCNVEQLMRNADAAMYYAKEHGRHKYHFYTREMSSASYDRLALEADLKEAIDNHQIMVYYQPQVCLQSKAIVGVEALVRWRHPELGILTPAQFLNIAELCGIMQALGETVLHLACRQMVSWKERRLPIDSMSVNIAGSQIHHGDLLQSVTRTLQETGCRAEWLELEITEDFIIKETGPAIETLQQLRDLGLSLAIDDFGTGYSSLSHLKRLPVNKLKIDRSFIRDINTDMEDAALVNAIITMGKNLGMTLIAEGVENSSHEIFLSAHGCDQAQGFHYSRPLPADELEAMLQESRQADV